MSFTPKHTDSAPTNVTLGSIKIGEGLMIDQYGVLHVRAGDNFIVDSSGILQYTGGTGGGSGYTGYVPSGTGAAPTIDPLASHVYGMYHFSNEAGSDTFSNYMALPYLNTAIPSNLNVSWPITAVGVNAFTTATGGVFSNTGTLQFGISDTPSIATFNTSNSQAVLSVVPPTDDFCIEGWFYPTSLASKAFLMGTYLARATQTENGGMYGKSYYPAFNPISCSVNPDGSVVVNLNHLVKNPTYSFFTQGVGGQNGQSTYLNVYDDTPINNNVSAAGVIVPDVWSHVALVRGLNKYTVYVNGIAVVHIDDNNTGVKYESSYEAAGYSGSSFMASLSSGVSVGGKYTTINAGSRGYPTTALPVDIPLDYTSCTTARTELAGTVYFTAGLQSADRYEVVSTAYAVNHDANSYPANVDVVVTVTLDRTIPAGTLMIRNYVPPASGTKASIYTSTYSGYSFTPTTNTNILTWTVSLPTNYMDTNGISKTSTQITDDYLYYPPQSLTDSFIGFLDELRITRNVPRYVGDFTPPIAAFAEINTTNMSYAVVGPAIL